MEKSKSSKLLKHISQRTVLDFSVRIDASIALSNMRVLIEQAFNCVFVESILQGTPCFISEILGMKIILGKWAGINNVTTFQLHGFVDDIRFLNTQLKTSKVEIIGIDISNAIIDLLEVRGAGKWRIPTRLEKDAESNYEPSNE